MSAKRALLMLDRYAAPNANFVLVAALHSGPGRAERAKQIQSTSQGRSASANGISRASRWLVAAAVLVVPVALRAQATPPAQTTRAVTTLTSPVTGNAVAGKKLYYDHACYSCHGFNGETGVRPFVPNWPANLATERSFVAFLRARANVAPVQPSTAMPNYPVESLSDAQARDIYAFIRSFKSAPPPIEKIPVMNEILAAAKKPYKP